VTASQAFAGLAYERVGVGEPVVLLHGLGATRRVWQQLVPRLSSARDVIAVDLLGFGDSPRPEGPIRLADLATSLVALLDDLDLESVDLIGNSLGGWLALYLAVVHPDRVGRVVAIAPAFVYGLPDGVGADQVAAAASPSDVAAMRQYMARVRADADCLTEDDIRTLLEERLARQDDGSIAALASSIAAGDDLLTGRLHEVAADTLILHGRFDGVVPLAQSARAADEIGGATLRLLDNSAHWPQIEEPDAVAAAVEEFLR